jgi:hypothetical protein
VLDGIGAGCIFSVLMESALIICPASVGYPFTIWGLNLPLLIIMRYA